MVFGFAVCDEGAGGDNAGGAGGGGGDVVLCVTLLAGGGVGILGVLRAVLYGGDELALGGAYSVEALVASLADCVGGVDLAVVDDAFWVGFASFVFFEEELVFAELACVECLEFEAVCSGGCLTYGNTVVEQFKIVILERDA